MNEIGISIIVPVYKGEQYIERCLQSITNQSYRNIEIICVYRDYPGDNSLNILKKFQQKDNRIVLLEQRSKGTSGARNEGGQIATGKYVYFVDSDDWIEPEALETIYAYMQQDDLDLLCFDAKLRFETLEIEKRCGQLWPYLNKKNKYEGVSTGKEIFVNMMQHDEFAMVVWLNAVKRQWLMDNHIHFIENICHEDNSYMVECFIKAQKVRYIKKELYNYRVREDSGFHTVEIKWDLYSRVVVYRNLLCFAHLEEQVEVQHQLIRYAYNFLEGILTLNNQLSQEDKENWVIEDALTAMLMKGMQIGKYELENFDRNLYIEGWKAKIEKAKSIVIYGAGEVGKQVYKYLEFQNLQNKVIAYAVTTKENSKDLIQGKPVWSIQEVKNSYRNDDILIIIAVDMKLGEELFQNCRKLNLDNVVRLDRTISHYLMFELENNLVIL